MPRKVIKVDTVEGLDIYLTEKQVEEAMLPKGNYDKPDKGTEKTTEFKKLNLE